MSKTYKRFARYNGQQRNAFTNPDKTLNEFIEASTKQTIDDQESFEPDYNRQARHQREEWQSPVHF